MGLLMPDYLDELVELGARALYESVHPDGCDQEEAELGICREDARAVISALPFVRETNMASLYVIDDPTAYPDDPPRRLEPPRERYVLSWRDIDGPAGDV